MKSKKMTGAILATAIAGMFVAGKAMSEEKTADKAKEATKEAAKVCCEGQNACAGKGGCKGAKSECKGKNSCKGKGCIEMTKDACDAASKPAEKAPAAEKK